LTVPSPTKPSAKKTPTRKGGEVDAPAKNLKKSPSMNTKTPAKTAPAKTPPAKTAPAKTAPAKTPPAKTAPAKTAPAKTAPAKTAPAKTAPAKTAPAKTAPAKTAPAKTAPAKTAPAKTAPAKTAPAKTAPAKTAPAKTAPAKTAPAKTAPAKTAPAKTAPAKSAAIKPALAKSIPDSTFDAKAMARKIEPLQQPSPSKPTRVDPDDIIVTKKQPLPIPPKTNTDPKIVEKIRMAHLEKERRKDLAQEPPNRKLTQNTIVPPVVKGEDRIVLMVRDPYWLHAHWDIARATVERAKAALVDHWHSVKPVLRLLKFDDSGTTESSETVYREIEIHGGVRNWYIDVSDPPSRFQIIMGYTTGNNRRFYELVRSNVVTTPMPGSKDSFDDHWADIAKDAEKIYAMSGGYSDETNKGELGEVFEDRLKRTMELDVLSQFGSGAEGSLRKPRQFHFDVEAELLVFGTTHPDAHVAIGSEPVKVQADGTFSARLPLPDRRQVLPATARSRDGVDERTVVIAVERNTKIMEPLSIDAEDL
jgi:uncharacterized protein